MSEDKERAAFEAHYKRDASDPASADLLEPFCAGFRASLAQQAGEDARDGWKLVPVEPTVDMLSALVYREWPADHAAGKKLQTEQRRRGLDEDERVPYKTEYEIAVGQYQRMLAAAPPPAIDQAMKGGE